MFDKWLTNTNTKTKDIYYIFLFHFCKLFQLILHFSCFQLNVFHTYICVGQLLVFAVLTRLLALGLVQWVMFPAIDSTPCLFGTPQRGNEEKTIEHPTRLLLKSLDVIIKYFSTCADGTKKCLYNYAILLFVADKSFKFWFRHNTFRQPVFIANSRRGSLGHHRCEQTGSLWWRIVPVGGL